MLVSNENSFFYFLMTFLGEKKPNKLLGLMIITTMMIVFQSDDFVIKLLQQQRLIPRWCFSRLEKMRRFFPLTFFV